MAKKIKKKTKIKVVPILMFLLLSIIVFFLISFFMKVKIKNIYVSGNTVLSEQEVIELANLEDYPSFLKTSSYSIKKRIKNNKYIKDVTVRKSLIATVKIYIEEYDLLFVKSSEGKVVLDNHKEIDDNGKTYSIPILVNYVPDTIYKTFVEHMKEIDKEIRNKISQIEYTPNDYDKSRFLLYMNDGNLVYLTISKFDIINKYDEIYPTLAGKKGILYLDSGNHFEIKG